MGFSAQRVRKANPVCLGNVLRPLVRNLGLEPVMFIEQIINEWDSIVGKANARNTRPIDLENDVLNIAVSSPVWMTQTRFYKSSFIDRINSYVSEKGIHIRDIHFKLESFKQE